MSRRGLCDKAVARGVASLTNQELTTIIIDDDGTMDEAKVAQIFDRTTINELSASEPVKLRQRGSMGIGRAVRLAAAFELGRRACAAVPTKLDTIGSSADVAKMFQPLLGQLKHEEFWVLYLNSANKIIDKVRVGQGGVNNLVVDHKIVIKRAVELLSTAIVIVHNHPSGESTPSEQDISLTGRLMTAASLFDIELLDHIIVTSAHCLSFRAQGFISEQD